MAPAAGAGRAPARVEFEVPGFVREFRDADPGLVQVTACREAACASATVMLGEGFSTALPTSAEGAEVTAQIDRAGTLRVTLQVSDAGPTGATAARSLGLTVTPAPGDGGLRRPYLQVVLPGCRSGAPSSDPVTCRDHGA